MIKATRGTLPKIALVNRTCLINMVHGGIICADNKLVLVSYCVIFFAGILTN